MNIRPQDSNTDSKDAETISGSSAEAAIAGAAGNDEIIVAQSNTLPQDSLVFERVESDSFDTGTITQRFTAASGLVVPLPDGATIARILIVGNDLVIVASDGSVLFVEGGASNPPSIQIGDLTLPNDAVTAAIQNVPETVPAAGPDGGSGAPGSSGNSFVTPEGNIASEFDLVDLLGFSDFVFGLAEDEEREFLEEDTVPIFLGAEVVTVEEDDLNQELGINYRFLTKKYAKLFWDQIENGEKDGVSVGNNEDGSIDAFTAMGNLNIDFQDDGPAAVDPIVFVPGQTAPVGLTSDGQQLTYEISPDGLTLRAFDDDGDVFTVVIDPTVPGGKYTFTLLDNIDHLPTQEGEELLNLVFSLIATDGDGSAVVGSFNVNIQDDVPVLLTKELLKELWEKEQEEPTEDKDKEKNKGNEQQEPSLSDDGEGGENGHDGFFKKLMLRMGKVDEDELNNFDWRHNRDGDDIEGSRGTDAHRYDRGDGSVKAQGSLGVLFGADDGEARSIVFNQDSETDSIQDPDGENGNCLTACIPIGDGEFKEIPLTSKGEPVKYVINEAGTMLIGYTGEPPEDPFGENGGNDDGPFIASRGGYGGGDDDGTRLIFKVALDDDDYGYFKFTLWDQLDHPRTDDPRTEEEETAFEDTIVLKFGFTATDSDGDSLDSELTIKVKDDIPELKCPHREDDWKYWEVISDNLIRNGSFEHFEGGLGMGGRWDYLADNEVPGWRTGPGDTPIEIQKSVYDNNYHGQHELELDSTDNYTIWQKVDTHDCGYYKLSFGYAPRPGFGEDTNGVKVFWNGELIATITGDGTGDEGFQWETYEFLVEGNGDHGVLAFRGIGESDSFGGMIDGVRLREIENPYQVQGYVDEDDLLTHLSHGTSPDGDTNWHFGLYFGTVSTSGWLSSLVKVGADEIDNYGPYTKGTFSFTDDAVETLEAMNLTSKGAELTYYTYGNYIVAVDDNGKPGPSLSDRPVFVLELTGKGYFKFTLKDQLDHDNPGVGQMGPAVEDILKIDFSKIVQVSDFDGDTVVLKDNSFVVKVRDDVPEHTNHKVWGYVNEDDLDTYLSHGTSPDHDTGWYGQISTDGYLNKLVKVGADEVDQYGRWGQHKLGEFNFTRNAEEKLEDKGWTSKGEELSYQIFGNTLVAYVNANSNYPDYHPSYDRKVFTLEIQENGYFKYTQWDQLDHDNPGVGEMGPAVQDILYLDFSHIVKFSDFDGDTIILKDDQFVIKVRDDVPETTGEKVWKFVSETDFDADKKYFEHPPVLSDGTSPDSDTRYDGSIGTEGYLSSLVKVGADETGQYGYNGQYKKGDFNFKGNAVRTMEYMALMSKGEALSYEIDGDTLIAYVNSHPDYPDYNSYYDRTVFTLELQENGYFKYIQYDQLDHKDDYDRPIDELKIDFSKIVKFSDFDGDTIMLDPWSFVVKVGDDEPELRDKEIHRTVDEDDIRTDLSEGTYSFNDNGPLKATGDLAHLVKVGADEDPIFMFKSNTVQTMRDLGLKSQGDALRYHVDGDTLIAYVEEGPNNSGYNENSDRTMFTLEVQQDGDFKYLQFDQLDHLIHLGPQYDDEVQKLSYLEIDFAPILKVSDYDWDTVMLRDGSFVIKVVDDEPYIGESKIVVDEDGLPGGNPFGPEDEGVTPPQNIDSGNLNILIGADEPGDINFASLHNEVVVDKDGNDIFSDGAPLKYLWDQSTHTLSAVTVGGGNPGTTIFTLAITDVATAAYTFNLMGPVDHPLNNQEDDINLKLRVEVKDYDHDVAYGWVKVLIDDDTPVIKDIEDGVLVAEDGVMMMGDIEVMYGGDGPADPGNLKICGWPEIEGYSGELNDDGTLLTVTEDGSGDVAYTVQLDPVNETYKFTLVNAPDLSSLMESETYELTFNRNWSTRETRTVEGEGSGGERDEAGVTFDGKIFPGGVFNDARDYESGSSSTRSRDDINPHSDNGFGIRGHALNDESYGLEGFEAMFNDGPVHSFAFDIFFNRGTDDVKLTYKLYNDGSEVGSNTTTIESPGYNGELGVEIDQGVKFDKILIMFDLPEDSDWRNEIIYLNDFEYTRKTGGELEFQVAATDNDDDETKGEFTVDLIRGIDMVAGDVYENELSGQSVGTDKGNADDKNSDSRSDDSEIHLDLSNILSQIGASAAATVAFTADVLAQMATLSLESKSEALSYAIDGTGKLVGFVDSGDAGLDDNDRVVFTVEIDTSGATPYLIYDQVDQFDHADPGVGTPGPAVIDDIVLEFGHVLEIEDDGTVFGLPADAVKVRVIDDVPTIDPTPTDLTVGGDNPDMAMGNAQFVVGADETGSLRITGFPDIDGVTHVLSPNGLLLTATIDGTNGNAPDDVFYTLTLDPVTGKYTFNLVTPLEGGTSAQIGVPLVFPGPFVDTLAATAGTNTVTFDGLLFTGSDGNTGSFNNPGLASDDDDLGRNGLGFGVRGGNGQKPQDINDDEGFQAIMDNPVTGFAFQIDGTGGGFTSQVSWEAFNGATSVGSGSSSVVVPNGPGTVPFDIDGIGAFDRVVIRFDHQQSNDTLRVQSFQITEDVDPAEGLALEYELTGSDHDGDQVVGGFTVNVEPEAPETKSIKLRIEQTKHSGGTFDQHYFDNLVIMIDDVPVSYSLVGGLGSSLSSDDLLLSGRNSDDDRRADLQIDNVPLDGKISFSATYSNGDGSRSSGAADNRPGTDEGVRFLLDAGDGFKIIYDYRNSSDYLGGDTLVARSFVANYSATGAVTPVSDPIVLDLNGDGASLVSPVDGVSFDLDGDGTAEQTGWVAPEDGLLALDLDGSGAIEDGSEVFSENFGEGGFANSLEALASLDDNGDGVIDSEDSAYDDILVWQDANSDGVSQAGELRSLAEHGIESIDLGATAVDIDADGNQIFGEGEFTLDDGTVGSYLAANLGVRSLSESEARQQRQTAAAEAIAAAIGAVVIIDMMTGDAVAATATVADAPANGEATVSADNSVMYEAADGFSGQDSFTVEVSDGNGGVEIKTVYLDVEDGVVTGSAVAGPDDAVLLGSEVAETLDASSDAAPAADGSEGDDDTVIVGGDGDDVLIGGEGDDTLIGGGGNDALHGNGGDDTLFGGAGDDELFGGDGEDVLVGGSGANELTGGGDGDVFVFTKAALDDGLLDQVLDYSFADGDTLDLTALFDTEGGDLNDFVAYDAASGDLSVDADGAGGESAKTIAKIDTGSGAAADLQVLFTDDGSSDSGVV